MFVLIILFCGSFFVQCRTVSKLGLLDELHKRNIVRHEVTTIRTAAVVLEAVLSGIELNMAPKSRSTRAVNRMNSKRHKLGKNQIMIQYFDLLYRVDLLVCELRVGAGEPGGQSFRPHSPADPGQHGRAYRGRAEVSAPRVFPDRQQ